MFLLQLSKLLKYSKSCGNQFAKERENVRHQSILPGIIIFYYFLRAKVSCHLKQDFVINRLELHILYRILLLLLLLSSLSNFEFLT